MFQDKLTKSIAEAAAQIKTEPPKNEVNTKSVEGAVVSIMANEELKGNQHKIDANKNGKVDAHDFKLLRAKKGMKEDTEQIDELSKNTLSGYIKKAQKVQIKDYQDTADTEGYGAHPERRKGLDRSEKIHRAVDKLAVKKTNEEVEQLDEIGDTARGQYLLSKTKERAKDREYSATKAVKPGQVRKQRAVASGANARMTDNTRIYGASSGAPSLKSRIGSTVKKAASAVKKVFTREELENMQQMHEADAPKPRIAGAQPGLYQKKMASLAKQKQSGHDPFGHDAKRQQSGYRGPGQSVLQTAADKVKAMGRAVKKAFTREEVETVFNDFTLDEIHIFVMSEEFGMLHVESQEQITSYLEDRSLFEESQIDEAFPTVADAKKRMASKESGFEKKKVSTGTVYSRKYKAEPEDNEEMPKKKAKTMKEMLNIYSTGGAEALVENLMIEEPSQDEYKKETEIAQAKSEGKIRNDKGIAKPATQGVKMEEVEIEVLDADEINGVQIDNIEERSMTDDEMDKREEIVKSMKKNMQGFKDRYGDKAKNVMYATAAKIAKKD